MTFDFVFALLSTGSWRFVRYFLPAQWKLSTPMSALMKSRKSSQCDSPCQPCIYVQRSRECSIAQTEREPENHGVCSEMSTKCRQAQSERKNSKAKYVVTDTRGRLSSKTVQAPMCLKSWNLILTGVKLETILID